MIKGVTKSIIEVNPRSSEYFEKAIIILRDNCSLSPEQLEAQAAVMLGKTAPECVKRSRKHNRLCMLASAAAGALFSALILLIAFVSFV
ncbi:MAG: hypothetical protein ACI4KM_12750 [Oscillospiraceae bacterium]